MIFVTGGSGFVGRNLIGYLAAQGQPVRACARSRRAAEIIRQAGAEPVSGDLSDIAALASGMSGCHAVVHAAANLQAWGCFAHSYADNVLGTRNVLRAATQTGVARFVHVSTEAVLVAGAAVIDADESYPMPRYVPGPYARTKALAEREVERAASQRLSTVIIRPRFVWGAGDTSQLPLLVRAARSGRFAWIDGGQFRTSTCHVQNLCEALWCAVRAEQPGPRYVVADGASVEMRAFGEALMRTQGIELPCRSVPFGAAWTTATLTEVLWRSMRLRGVPPVTRSMVASMGREITLDDRKARQELGYRGCFSPEEGLAQMERWSAAPR